MKKWFEFPVTFLHIFAILGIALLPFPFYLFDFQQRISPWLFGGLVDWLTNTGPAHPDFSSDAPGLFWLTGILCIMSALITAVFFTFPVLYKRSTTLLTFCRLTAVYYLSLQLLKYGFDKVFKAQFYLPEPNILYTPAGRLDRDILFWTTMGTSWSYNVFMGLLEVGPALFLIFRHTRVFGILASAAVLLNVVMINFSFGITVKLFSCFLLFLALLLLLPYYRSIFQFFRGNHGVALPLNTWILPFNLKPYFKTGLKTMVVGVLLLEALYPYLKSGILNDDHTPRPAMHGAYEVIAMKDSAQTFDLPKPYPVKRFFIHRQGYLIFQNQDDQMQDFKLSVNHQQGIFKLTDYQLNIREIQFKYNDRDSTLMLQSTTAEPVYFITGRRLPYRDLPAIR